MRRKIADFYKRTRFLFRRYERILIPLMLLVGTTADFITFKTLNIKTSFIILSIYVVIAGFSIYYLNAFIEYKWESKSKILIYLEVVMRFLSQFTFGALLSASLVFYWFSGSFSISWPVMIVIVLLMASNEVLRKYYLKPIVQIVVYYFIIFSFLILILPFISSSLSYWTFVLAGIGSLLFIALFIEFISYKLRYVKWERKYIYLSVVLVYFLMNGFYIMNLIPPIPLSLRDVVVSDSLMRTANAYELNIEDEKVLNKIFKKQRIHIEKNSRVYVFNSIYAPSKLTTKIVHEWEWFDDVDSKWIKNGSFSYGIVGGRQEGYRGYSYQSIKREGMWRVTVKTDNGQTLGRIKFNVSFDLEGVIKTKIIR